MAKNYFYKNYKKALEKGTLRSGPPSADYKLVWHDEFNGEKVDTAKWKIYDIKPNKWNKYRYLNPSQLKVSDGTLKMTTELKNGVVYEPRISSTKRFVTTYGYIEASIKLHNTKYADASFWMLPEGRMDPSDPVNKGMEIDIMECVLPMYGGVTHTTHWYGYCPKLKKSFSRSGGTCSQNVPKLNKKFHVFGFEWLPNALVFYIDGVESWRLDKKDHPIPACDHNIIFSFGGTKAKIIRLPKFSATFEVDYVRVYKKKQK